MHDRRTRRRFLQGASVAAVAGMSGCSGESGPSTETDEQGGGGDTTPKATTSQRDLDPVEVDEEWALHRFDLANTGYSTNSGPTDDVEIRWHRSFEDGVKAAPVLADGRLFVASYGSATAHALDPGTGEVLWENELGTSIDHGPTVVDDTAYFCMDDQIHALDVATGEARWTFTENLSIDMTPTVVDGMVYFGEGPETLHAVDAETGTEQWQLEYAGSAQDSLAYADGVLYLASHTHLHAIDVEKQDFLWTTTVPGDVSAGPAVASDKVLVGGKHLQAHSAATGEKLWTFDELTDPRGVPAVDGDLIYTGGFGSDQYAVTLSDGTKQWSTTLNAPPQQTVTDEGIYVSAGRMGVVAFDPVNGDQLWKHRGPSSASSIPIVANGLLFIGDSEGLTVYQGI